jgi:apolipoprotein N-acyltransferase
MVNSGISTVISNRGRIIMEGYTTFYPGIDQVDIPGILQVS